MLVLLPRCLVPSNTCNTISLCFRLSIRFLQSSLAALALALTASTLSADTTAPSRSPWDSTAFNRAWPCSLSLRNSCGAQVSEMSVRQTERAPSPCGRVHAVTPYVSAPSAILTRADHPDAAECEITAAVLRPDAETLFHVQDVVDDK